MQTMQHIASVERTTPKGHHSVWHFVQANDAYYAFGGCHKALVKRFDNMQQLQSLYEMYIGYGYEPVSDVEQLAIQF